jgi:NADPH-dependent 2,4-dienoyl-CoA reductase/sulfur reductase-like enzyme/rhodanese-related sulfurtransferase
MGTSPVNDNYKKEINNNCPSDNSSGEKIVIIGGISAGTSAAAKARRYSEKVQIVIYEKYKYISYATCGLPYYISEKISEPEDLIVTTVRQFELRFNVKVNVKCEVIKIDPSNKILTVRNLETGIVFNDNYGKLIIATGTAALSFNQELLTLKNVFSLRTVDDALELKKYIDKSNEGKPGVLNVVIIGGGYIGLELLEAFLSKDCKVTIIEKTSQILPVFDKDIIEYIENYLIGKGVFILKEEEVKEIQKDDRGILKKIITSKGTGIEADIVVLSIGTRPETKIASDCGIALGEFGGIKVNEFLQTSIPDIYAAGDCCECENFVNNKKQSFNLASIANMQGRCAGYNAAGGSSKFHDAVPTSIIKILDISIGKTGMTLKEAKAAGLAAKKIELHSLNHAGYYPGATMMHLIIIYDESTGTILGFQAVGREGIDKKTDIISVAIRTKMKIWELVNFNLSYQPAFGSAKDPLNILGMIGENIFKQELKLIDVEELRDGIAVKEDLMVLDVRTKREFDHGHIETAVNIPVDELRDNINKIDKKSNIVVYCGTSYRSYLAYRILANNGFENIRNLNGSYLSWMRKI